MLEFDSSLSGAIYVQTYIDGIWGLDVCGGWSDDTQKLNSSCKSIINVLFRQ